MGQLPAIAGRALALHSGLTCCHRDRGGGHRAGIGEGAHLGTKIEFGPRRLGAHADVLLVRLAAA